MIFQRETPAERESAIGIPDWLRHWPVVQKRFELLDRIEPHEGECVLCIGTDSCEEPRARFKETRRKSPR
jgi:hypothetical protein